MKDGGGFASRRFLLRLVIVPSDFSANITNASARARSRQWSLNVVVVLLHRTKSRVPQRRRSDVYRVFSGRLKNTSDEAIREFISDGAHTIGVVGLR
jgi:hypothetical protein